MIKVKEETQLLKEEVLFSNSLKNSEDINLEVVEENQTSIKSKLTDKLSVKQEYVLHNKNDIKPSHSTSFSWPSLWKNGPRRSAFQPYKPSGKVVCSSSTVPTDCLPNTSSLPSEPGPASTTVMTNLQRGNIQAESPATDSDMSWFMLAGRGDITDEQLHEMFAQGKDIDCVDEEGLSGMMWAAFHGQIHTVQIFLEVNAEVDRQGMWGETALMLAATEGHLEIVKILINAEANVNHEDHFHSTPLMCAVYGDYPHIVHELLVNGADMWVHSRDNYTAYDIAVNQKSYKSKAVLEKYICALITDM